ncbi:hypothetical protein ABH924_003774 [Arthrobacter sp. GAS37]
MMIGYILKRLDNLRPVRDVGLYTEDSCRNPSPPMGTGNAVTMVQEHLGYGSTDTSRGAKNKNRSRM